MVEIKNMQGEVIARLGEEQGCTDDLSTAFLDELDLSNALPAPTCAMPI